MSRTLCRITCAARYNNQQARYPLSYKTDRSDLSVYAHADTYPSAGLGFDWLVEEIRDPRTREERLILTAAGTERPGMPANPTADEYWKYAALSLALIDNNLVLSGMGIVRTSPEVIVPEAAYSWLPRPSDFKDMQGRTITAFWLESMAWPGGYLSWNRGHGGDILTDAPLGLNHKPSDNAEFDMTWILTPVAAKTPETA